jgi:flagellar hook assembly protein FlgD
MWPNPFNPVLAVEIELDRSRHLRVDVFTVAGQHVRRLVSGVRPRGVHRFEWDGTDDAGHGVASGVYLLRFVSDGWRTQRKAVLLK